MPKLIDYPRTSYPGAWEVAEIVDDTGGKCALETCARKLNRKVSGSFKAIVGSGVKFGLLTSKRELLATTTLFRRIKHAYDKQEELLFHREAFLTPPLFTQLCRKFRSRELPVAMLDVLLMREFGVEEINAQSVAKAFIDGARMVNILDEHNVIADIDQLAAKQPPRRELASPTPAANVFRQLPTPTASSDGDDGDDDPEAGEPTDAAETDETTGTNATPGPAHTPAPAPAPTPASGGTTRPTGLPPSRPAPAGTADAIANLFGLNKDAPQRLTGDAPATPTPLTAPPVSRPVAPTPAAPSRPIAVATSPTPTPLATFSPPTDTLLFQIQLAGPGINTQLDVTDAEDLALIRALLDKIERQLRK